MRTMSQIFVKLFKLSLLLCALNGIDGRDITAHLNPGCGLLCNQTDRSVNVVHMESTGEEDSVHFLWAVIERIPPTLVVFQTKHNTSLAIDWEVLLNDTTSAENAIRLSSPANNSMAIQFSRLFFFNDIDSKGSYETSDPTLVFDWDDFVWETLNDTVVPKGTVGSVSLRLSNAVKKYNESIAFDLRVDSSDGRNTDLPHLAFTETSASFDITVADVETRRDEHFARNDTIKARLVASLLVVKSGSTDKGIDLEVTKSIDDEYTPGVFKKMSLNLKTESESSEGFVQYKPIAYNAEQRIIANTLDVIPSPVQSVNESLLHEYKSRVLVAFFGRQPNTSHAFNLTFGAADSSDYYDKTKYHMFSLVVGLGSAPDEKLSFLVQMIILVGFGLPLLVMVVSAVYLIVRKVKKRKSNDLLLNRSQQTLTNSGQ